MNRASLDDLAAFAMVARLGSFTRAAGQIGTSVSNLSHTIRRLEARVGTRLLQRNSRSVAPTEVGMNLLATLGPALDNIEGALDLLDHGRDRVVELAQNDRTSVEDPRKMADRWYVYMQGQDADAYRAPSILRAERSARCGERSPRARPTR